MSVSSSPSRSEAAAPGWLRRVRRQAPSCSRARSWSSSAHAWRSRRLTAGWSRSGRCSSTFRSLWRTQRCTGARSPKTSRIALRSGLEPSITHSTPCVGSRPRSTRSASSALATVAFSVEPSQSPSATFMPAVVIPRQTTFVRSFSSMRSSISTARRTSSSWRAISSPSAARPGDERARDRRLALRASVALDIGADRFLRATEAASRDAREHPLEHDRAQRIAVSEVPIGRQWHLGRPVDGARPRPVDRHSPPAECDLTGVVAMPHRDPIPIVTALQSHDLVELLLHQLLQHAEPDADRQRQQPLPRGADQLTERLLHSSRQATSGTSSAVATSATGTLLLNGGSSFDLGGSPRTLPPRADEAGGTAVSISTGYGTTSAAHWRKVSDRARFELGEGTG